MTREQLIDYLESVLNPSGRAVTVADFNLIPDILSALRGERDTTTTSWYSKKLYCDTCGERIIGKKHNYCPMCGRKLEVKG